MLLRTLEIYQPTDSDIGRVVLQIPAMIVLWALIALGLTAFIWALLEAIGTLAGTWTNSLLYGVIGLVALFGLMRRGKVEKMTFAISADTEPRLLVGKLEVVRRRMHYGLAYVLGALVGMQIGLLYYTHDHAGVAGNPDLDRCILLTLDNLGQGVLLDIFEIYGVAIAGYRPERTFWGDNLEYVFRLGYNALAIVLFFQVVKKIRMEQPLKDPPKLDASPRVTAEWMDERFRRSNLILRHFPDETIFMIITAHFLDGRFDLARRLARCFPHLPVSDDVRRLYVDGRGKSVFPAPPDRR